MAGGGTNQTTYFSGILAGSMTPVSSDGDGTRWNNLADNNYLQVSSQIAIYNRFCGSEPFYNVPFIDVADNCGPYCIAFSMPSSGSRVNIKLRIKKRFVGAGFIVNEPIVFLYAYQGGPGLGWGSRWYKLI